MKPLKDHIAEMDELVLAVTGFTSDELSQIKFEIALRYLEDLSYTERFGFQELSQSAAFWGHWKVLWYQVDAELFDGSDDTPPVFLIHESTGQWLHRMPYGNQVVGDMKSAYIQYHDVKRMSWQMNSTVMEDSLRQTIQEYNNTTKPTQ